MYVVLRWQGWNFSAFIRGEEAKRLMMQKDMSVVSMKKSAAKLIY